MEGQEDKGKGVMTPRNSSKQLTALVVDDEEIVRKIHQGLLKRIGVKSQAAKNGKEAVDIHRGGQSFDIILMDRDMPIMNGIEATKELRSMGIGSMIIGVSSETTEAGRREFMKAGLDEYQVKPLPKDVLSSILDKMNGCNNKKSV